MADLISKEAIEKILAYNSETGVFTWKISPSLAVKSGDLAGTNIGGYIRIGINGRVYSAHRLAWLIIYGKIPEFDIDHINGNKSDNSAKNLRVATDCQNSWNSKKSRRNKSGIKGVFWYKAGKKWAAQVRKNGVKYFLGYYKDISKAEMAVKAARCDLHGQYANHGENK